MLQHLQQSTNLTKPFVADGSRIDAAIAQRPHSAIPFQAGSRLTDARDTAVFVSQRGRSV